MRIFLVLYVEASGEDWCKASKWNSVDTQWNNCGNLLTWMRCNKVVMRILHINIILCYTFSYKLR